MLKAPPIRTVSSRALVVVLLVVAVGGFAMVATGMLRRAHQIAAAVGTEVRTEAADELRLAVQAVQLQARDRALSMVSTEPAGAAAPVRNPHLPAYVTAIGWYRPDRSAARLQGELPDRVPPSGDYVAGSRGYLSLVLFVPVASAQGVSDNRVGYVGLRMDLIAALRAQGGLHHLNLASLSLGSKTADRLPLAEVLSGSGLVYSARPSTLATQLDRLADSMLVEFGALIVLLAAATCWVVNRFFGRPLRRMRRHLGALHDGYAEPMASPEHLAVAEVEGLRSDLNRLQTDMDRTHSRFDEQRLQLWTMAHVDPLTGVYNRRAFDHDWRGLRTLAANQRMHISFLLFDCDQFKAINDRYGHAAGDRAIRATAQALHGALRKGDRLYRLGGDEFAAVLLNADAAEADRIGRRCRQLVSEQSLASVGIAEPLSVSIGLSHVGPADIDRLAELPRYADVAMYHAKRSASGTVAHYRPDMEAGVAARDDDIAVVRNIIDTDNDDRLQILYRPVVRLDSDAVEYYEAVAHVRTAEGLLGPAQIAPTLARGNLQARFSERVLVQVSRELGRLPPATMPPVGVNVSAAALVSSALLRRLAELLTLPHGVRPVVEMTEADVVLQLQQGSDLLHRLRDQGFRLALDDFGSGYCSIRNLVAMQVDFVKLDAALMGEALRDPRMAVVIKRLGTLLRDAGYAVVAQGVDSDALRGAAAATGVALIEGDMSGALQPADALWPR